MKEKLLVKSVLTQTTLIQLFYVGYKVTKRNIQYSYQIVTYFRFTNKVHKSKLLNSEDATLLFKEMCSSSI